MSIHDVKYAVVTAYINGDAPGNVYGPFDYNEAVRVKAALDEFEAQQRPMLFKYVIREMRKAP